MTPNKNFLQHPINDAAFIKKLLPHREPMILVDVLQYFDGLKAICGLTILESNIFVEDNMFSETGLIEHMAQAAALTTGYKNETQNLPIKEGFIASIKNLKIESLPEINDTISTEVETTYDVANMTIVSLVVTLHENIIASTIMTLVLKENE